MPQRVFVLVFLVLGVIIQLGATETRHIHVLKIFDDNNPNYTIREGCRSINFGIDQEIELIRHHLGVLNVWEYNIRGSRFDRDRIDEVLDYELEYQERDIVILVYVGHGFRRPGSQDPLPQLYFNGYSDALALSDIQQRILERSPSLLISVVVACNVTQQDNTQPPPYLGDNEAPPIVSMKGVMRSVRPYYELFAEQDGLTKVIDLISADKEYYSFLSRDGGIFFNEVLYSFREVFTNQLLADWNTVCDYVMNRTTGRSAERGLRQRPFCRYYLQMNPIRVMVSDHQTHRPSYCRQSLQGLRKQQRQELRDLRRRHRAQMRALRQQGVDRTQRRLLGREQRVEVETRKLQHEQIYARQWQQCRN